MASPPMMARNGLDARSDRRGGSGRVVATVAPRGRGDSPRRRWETRSKASLAGRSTKRPDGGGRHRGREVEMD